MQRRGEGKQYAFHHRYVLFVFIFHKLAALLSRWNTRRFGQAVSALTFSLDGCFLYSGGEDAMVSSWNMLAVVDPEGVEVSQARTRRVTVPHMTGYIPLVL